MVCRLEGSGLEARVEKVQVVFQRIDRNGLKSGNDAENACL